MNLGINFTQIQPLLNEVYDWSVENLKSGMLHDGNVRNIGIIVTSNISYIFDRILKEIILKLADKGLTAEKIGLTLRDQYGIPKIKIYGFLRCDVARKKCEDC